MVAKETDRGHGARVGLELTLEKRRGRVCDVEEASSVS